MGVTMSVKSIVVLCAVLVASASIAFADADDTVVSRNPDFINGVKAVKAEDWQGAIALFTKVVAKEPKNADAFNYLGYSHRKLGEMDAAFKDYGTALSINPDHKGAHEYIGEAYLMVNDLPKAKEHLARLDKICWLGCEEFRDLKKAV